MNARQHEYRLSLELRQVNDVVSCVFHSLMVHRTVAKFQYKSDNNYSLGSLGITEVDCEHIDLTYVRLNSPELALKVEENVAAFRSDLVTAGASSPRRTPVGSPIDSAVPFTCASIGIEFYQKKHRSWPYSAEMHPWEKWVLQLDIYKVSTIDELARMRESVAESLGDVVLSICSSINRPQYLPKMPIRSELANVFDTNFSDCQPYLFNINRQATPASMTAPQSAFSTMRRLVKDFAL